MGKLISIFFLLIIGVSNAQQYQEAVSIRMDLNQNIELKTGDSLGAKGAALAWLSENYNKDENVISLSLISKLISAKATHFRYQLIVNGLPIYGGQIKIKLENKSNTVLSISASNFWFRLVQKPFANSSDYVLIEESLIPVVRKNSNSQSDYINTTKFINRQGEVIEEINNNSNKSDTTATVQVFYPEPITSIEKPYGIPYTDNNDAINPQLLAEHFLKEMPLTFRNDSFRLENEYFKLNEHSLPTEPVWTGITDSIIYNRSDEFFEQINIFYHLSNFRQHLDSLGYSSLGKKQLNIDAHGFSGADASAYTSSFNPPRLTFGQGGVDDGEDPGIIIHEYVHGLSDFAAPKSNLGIERIAIDEGICDYFSISYNRNISSHRYTDIFKWDGHNEFWGGRKINPAQHYPEDINGTSHMAGGLFTVILVDLSNKIGRNNTDKLALDVMYDFMPKLTFPDLSKLLMQSEKSLFKGKYKRDVCDVLWNHGLIVECFVGIEEMNNRTTELLVLNSDSFSKKEGDLKIIIPNKMSVKFKIINISGQTIQEGKSELGHLRISPTNLNSGVYFILFPENRFKGVKVILY